jgi:Tol biopolymer transport system component
MAALPGSNTGGKENLWMSERISGKWSEAAPLPPAVNELAMHWTVSVAENYNLYFSAATERPDNDLYLSRWADGRYQKPERLPQPLNSDNNEYTPNIAPDESYILFSRFRGHSDTPRLYVSYSAQNGWSEPKLVENVPYCISPVVTPDRAYVIFLSSASSLSWRNTAFIEDLRATR